MFSIPISIEDKTFERAMLDLGASNNVMPHHIYEQLSMGPIHPTNITIQLADKSTVKPVGLVEDVLVRVG